MFIEIITNKGEGFEYFRFLPSIEILIETRLKGVTRHKETSLGFSLFHYSIWFVFEKETIESQ
jgi:hypothetical protein